MTAVAGLDRLEAAARLHAADAPPRDVFVSVGEAELVIFADEETVLGHWSLAGMRRLDDGTGAPARYAPADTSDEILEIAETDLIAVLDRVRAAVHRTPPQARRARRWALWGGMAAAAVAVVFAAPGLLRREAAEMLPQAQRDEIGSALLRAVSDVAGPPCANPLGTEALGVLRDRLFPNEPVRLRVVPDMPVPSLALPGGLLVLSEDALLEHDDPAVAAGHLVRAAADGGDAPLRRFLGSLGPFAVARLMGADPLEPEVYADHARTLFRDGPGEDGHLGTAFAAANVDPGPWAGAVGAAVDPAPGRPPPLDDQDWQSLRGICEA